MEPAVPPPKGLVGQSIDFKLKPGWRYDEAQRVFVDRGGARFAPPPLPEKSRILYKVPTLARSAARKLSRAEQDLQRYMHVLLPPAESPQRHVASIRTWPCVEEAHVAPEVSLPAQQAPEPPQ